MNCTDTLGKTRAIVQRCPNYTTSISQQFALLGDMNFRHRIRLSSATRLVSRCPYVRWSHPAQIDNLDRSMALCIKDDDCWNFPFRQQGSRSKRHLQIHVSQPFIDLDTFVSRFKSPIIFHQSGRTRSGRYSENAWAWFSGGLLLTTSNRLVTLTRGASSSQTDIYRSDINLPDIFNERVEKVAAKKKRKRIEQKLRKPKKKVPKPSPK